FALAQTQGSTMYKTDGTTGDGSQAITYNGTSYTEPYDFRTKQPILTATFTVTKAGDWTINNKFVRVDDTNSDPYVANEVIKKAFVNEDVVNGSTQPSTSDTTPTPTASTPVGNEYSVINNLVNASSSNSASTVKEGASFTTTLSPASGYKISTVIATNGDDTITATENADGTYTISCTVKGEIVITCIAVEAPTPITSTTTTSTTSTTATEPTTSTAPIGDTVTLTLVDGTPQFWLADADAVFVLIDNSTGTSYNMSGGAGTWTVTVPSSVTNITINRNNPTNGETWNSWSTTRGTGTTYTATSSGVGSWDGGSGGDTPTTPQPSGDTVQFTDNQGWGTVYAYFFDGSNTVGSEWPGTQMGNPTDNGFGQTNYSISVPSGATKVVFSNGNGTQTVDTDLGHTGYYTDGTKDDKGHYVTLYWD
ncbi:MAG: starch-binding protein, partial [Ruminococcus sp.]